MSMGIQPPDELFASCIFFTGMCVRLFVDTAMHINTAMFEQSGGSGYVLKPQVMWDKSHPLYNKFNPTEKDVEGLHPYIFTLYVSFISKSGQHLRLSGVAPE